MTVIAMTENNQAAAGADAPGGLPYYEQSRTQLKSLLAKRRDLEKKLVSVTANSCCLLSGMASSNALSRCRAASKRQSTLRKQSISTRPKPGTS